jgi:hypothetical protein
MDIDRAAGAARMVIKSVAGLQIAASRAVLCRHRAKSGDLLLHKTTYSRYAATDIAGSI